MKTEDELKVSTLLLSVLIPHPSAPSFFPRPARFCYNFSHAISTRIRILNRNSFICSSPGEYCSSRWTSDARTLTGGVVVAPEPPAQDYLVYVVSESADEITLVRFGPQGGRVERKVGTGVMPSDLDGPHGIAISKDKQFYFVSLAHGAPNGTVWKYSAKNDAVLGKVTLGMFPATLDVSPDGQFIYVVNFNLHGDMIPSSVSVVSTELMTELARITTCTMPHGSRFNPQGTKHYSACMMDDMLVEIDTASLKVSRHFMLTKGREMGMTGAPRSTRDDDENARNEHGHEANYEGHGRAWDGSSKAGRRVVLAHLGAAFHGRRKDIRRVQQV